MTKTGLVSARGRARRSVGDTALRATAGAALCLALSLALSLGAVVVASLPAGAAGAPPASAAVPKGVQTDVGHARAELAKMKAVLAGLQRQQKEAKADLATFTKDLKDGALGEAQGGAKLDQASAAIAKAFSTHANDYDALALQATLFHQQFVSSLTAADLLYTATEASGAR